MIKIQINLKMKQIAKKKKLIEEDSLGENHK